MTLHRPLDCYASHTGTKRNLAALRAAGWGLLLSREGHSWSPEDFEKYVLDPGAWFDFKSGSEFDDASAEKYDRLLALRGAGAQWATAPDIVGAGRRSLELSTRWLNRMLSCCPLTLIAVQDGMEEADLEPLVGPSVGIFLGGTTEWKLATMGLWGRFCARRDIYYHVARVNTIQRINAAQDAGAWSIDGTSVTMYADTLPMLDRARRQPSLLDPRTPANASQQAR